jgi:hypothetical protein
MRPIGAAEPAVLRIVKERRSKSGPNFNQVAQVAQLSKLLKSIEQHDGSLLTRHIQGPVSAGLFNRGHGGEPHRKYFKLLKLAGSTNVLGHLAGSLPRPAKSARPVLPSSRQLCQICQCFRVAYVGRTWQNCGPARFASPANRFGWAELHKPWRN